MVVRSDHGAERIHRPREGLGAQRGWHLGGPVVVRVGAVQSIGVGKGLHELGAEAVLEVSGSHCGSVHCVPFTLTPLGTSVLEPHLKGDGEEGRERVSY